MRMRIVSGMATARYTRPSLVFSKKDISVLSVTVTAENRMASEVRSTYSRPFV